MFRHIASFNKPIKNATNILPRAVKTYSLTPLTQQNTFSASTSSDTQFKKEVRMIVERCEERPWRRQRLYSSYIDGVTDFGDGKVSVLDLANRFNITPHRVFNEMYWGGVRNRNGHNADSSNLTIFQGVNSLSLPGSHTVLKQKLDSSGLNKRNHELMYEMKMKYLTNPSIGFTSQNSDLKRYPVREFSKIVLAKNDDYDQVSVDIKQDDNEIVLTEEYRPDQCFDSFSLSKVFELSKNSRDYIRTVGGIVIKNFFDGSHFYNVQPYDKAYGQNAFHSVMVSHTALIMDNVLLLRGENSIFRQKTIDLIKKCADTVAENDKQLAKRIYSDFVNNSRHTNADTQVEIKELLNMYDIESHELLYFMYKVNAPFGAGILAFLGELEKATNFTTEDAKNVLIKQHYYVDYLYGHPIKNSFRKTKGEEQVIRVQKFDDRVFPGAFYTSLMILMRLRLQHFAY